MVDLLGSARAGTARTAEGLRPLPVGAAVAGLVSAIFVLLACLAVAVGGWLGSGAAAQGSTSDALRAGADAWLLGQGAHLDLGDSHITAVPLGLSVLCAWVCFRMGRWARRTSAPADARVAGLAAATLAGTYGVVSAVTAVAAGSPAAAAHALPAFAGAFVLAFLTGGAGLASDRPWRSRLPEPVAAVLTGSAATVLVTVACSALALAGSLLHGFGAAANVLSGLHVDAAGGLLYTVVVACVVPNAALLTGSYLLGPGFQVGAGTVVSPAAVSLGPVPAFPLLAALPGDGPGPWWVLLLVGVPVLAATVAGVLALRRHPVRSYQLGALRGLLGGLGGGVLLATVAGGSVGPGRMSQVGAGFTQVLPAAALLLATGGLLGGLVGTFWARRS